MDKKRILAVDDNSVNLAAIEKALQEDYEVIPILSGRRAVKFMSAEAVDLILLDYEMPIMNGVMTLKEIRNVPNGKTVPVLFLTANTERETIVEGSKLGIMDYITKPFDADDLNKRIGIALKKAGVMPVNETELHNLISNAVELLENNQIAAVAKVCDNLVHLETKDEIHNALLEVQNLVSRSDVINAIQKMKEVDQIVKGNLDQQQDEQEQKMGEIRRTLTRAIVQAKMGQTVQAKETCATASQLGLTEEQRAFLLDAYKYLESGDLEIAESFLNKIISLCN